MEVRSDVPALTSDDLLTWCRERGLEVTLLRPGVPTPTVPEAALAVGVREDQVLKSLVFLHDAKPMLVIAAGRARLSYPRLAAALETNRRRVRMASPEEALAISGYPVGAMPPFGHLEPLETFLEAAVVGDNSHAAASRMVVAGGGARDALLAVSVGTLQTATGARVLHLVEPNAKEA